MKFYDRKKELKLFEEKLKNKKAYDLIVLSGRRRVGKTELIKHLDGVDFYFYVTEETSSNLLKSFEKQVRYYFNDEFLSFDDWESFLKFLVLKSKENKEQKSLCVVFDEFQNFRKVEPAFFSILQKFVDAVDFDKVPIKFICTGSYLNMIKEIFNKSSSALYGRKTGEVLLKPLEFKYVFEILSDFKIKKYEEIVNIYGLFGGIPRYYKLIENVPFKNCFDLFEKVLFSEISPLTSEVREVFFEDVLNVKKEYLSILKAVSLGYNTNKLISDFTKIERTSLPTYLKELIYDYEVLLRKVPVTDSFDKSKKGIYVIRDNFLLFWFRFIEKFRSYFELGEYGFIRENIRKDYSDFIDRYVFEELSREYVKKRLSGFLVDSWWKGSIEIDVCGYNLENRFIFGECKWTSKKVGFDVYNKLIEKIEKGNFGKIEKVFLFSKSGFDKKLIDKANELNLELVDLKKLVDFLVV